MTELEEADLRERVEKLENLAKHQAGLLIVFYNWLYRSSLLTLDVSQALAPVNHLDPMAVNAQAGAAQRVREGMTTLGSILQDIFARLEPQRELLAETD